jgi:hypothetical protein
MVEGLSACDALARNHSSYQSLDVPQLLKHILGLHRTTKKTIKPGQQINDRYRLLYLFYDIQGEVGEAHREEAEKFKQAVDGEIDFQWVTYQTLVSRLKELSNSNERHSEYFDYLKNRYQLG